MQHDSLHRRPAHGLELAPTVRPESLGSAAFRQAYGLRYAYLAGSMYKGIASPELVVAMGRAGLMGFLGTGGLSLERIESDIRSIQTQLHNGQPWGLNLLHHPTMPNVEDDAVDLYLRCGIRRVEASAYMRPTPAVVRFRLNGVYRTPQGAVVAPNRIIAKVSRPEVAELFLRPAPPRIVADLAASGRITAEEALLSRELPLASEICVEADSGGHTDRGVAFVLLPAMLDLRDRIAREQGYAQDFAIGAAGGIGTPQAAAAAFILGADFIVSGSINQCTVEAGTSDAVKDMLQEMDVQDTDYAPAGDMFELGAKVQVLKKGVLFPARAAKLLDLYRQYASIEELGPQTRTQLEERIFRRSFEEVWQETRSYYARVQPSEIDKAERNPKQKMALIFKWYFSHSTRLAMCGSVGQRVDYQVHCGPAMGAFNRWARGSEIECWRQRRVADIGERIMRGAAEVLGQRLAALLA
jgi:trans-AT polyketide synthase/acyltransferase/oxidoreductase domain-containing protein